MDLLTSSTSYSQGDHSWLASAHGLDNGQTVTLDLTGFVKATHFPDGYIPSGMGLALNATTEYIPYDPAVPVHANQGIFVGRLVNDVVVANDDGTDGVGDALGSMIIHGHIVEANLPAGDATDASAKTDNVLMTYR